MTEQILFPALSPTMEKGSLIKWHVKVGDKVSPGDLLAEIETDKATIEFEAVEEGIIEKLLVKEGPEEVLVNSPIAEFKLLDEIKASSPDVSPKKELNVRKEKTTREYSSESKEETFQIITTSKKPEKNKSNRVRISPLAKKLAESEGINVKNVSGTGPYGRIIKKDILKEIDKRTKATITVSTEKTENTISASSEDSKPPAPKSDIKTTEYEIIPLSRMRRIIAERLSESKSTIPHFYLRRTVMMDKVLENRSLINEFAKERELKISINDFVIKACAKSLKDNPMCNCIWANDKILKLNNFDVGVAVALEEGLITPIIRNADKKSLGEISSEMKVLAEKAKNKKLQPNEYTGGSFAISNLGMMGVENFDAVINPPNSSILAVGATIVKPIAREDGTLYSGSVMSITLSADHRVIDGAVGANFIGSVVNYLENPLLLML